MKEKNPQNILDDNENILLNDKENVCEIHGPWSGVGNDMSDSVSASRKSSISSISSVLSYSRSTISSRNKSVKRADSDSRILIGTNRNARSVSLRQMSMDLSANRSTQNVPFRRSCSCPSHPGVPLGILNNIIKDPDDWVPTSRRPLNKNIPLASENKMFASKNDPLMATNKILNDGRRRFTMERASRKAPLKCTAYLYVNLKRPGTKWVSLNWLNMFRSAVIWCPLTQCIFKTV